MNFKHIKAKINLLLLLLLLGCAFPKWEWEDLDSNYDHVLNVMGLINLDSNSLSFIGLYRTTDLDELSQVFVGLDSVYIFGDEEGEKEGAEEGYWIYDSIYEPAALIKNAEVIVSDDNGNSWPFSFVEKFTTIDTVYFDTTLSIYGYTFNWDTTYYDTNEIRINFYLDTTGTFDPLPQNKYYLNITATGYDPVLGEMITPNFPVFIDSSMQDTIVSSEPYDLSWEENLGRGYITTELMIMPSFSNDSSFNYSSNDSSYIIRSQWCDIHSESSIEFDQGSTSIGPYWCDEIEYYDLDPERFLIRLTAMDDNYYSYFIEGELEEYSNMLLDNSSTKGRSVGIEGGFGFFGSIASDYTVKIIVP